MDRLLSRLLKVNDLKTVALKNVPVDLEKLVYETLAQLSQGNMGEVIASTTWNLEITPGLRCITDVALLQTVLSNLLDNALEYRHQSRRCAITVRAEAHSQHNTLRLVVIDNGNGISTAAADRIFDMFFRGTEASQGLGLGLYMVKLAAERLGGTVRLCSSEGPGAAFEVNLPTRPLPQRSQVSV
jgi:signal transduction histidine kinase